MELHFLTKDVHLSSQLVDTLNCSKKLCFHGTDKSFLYSQISCYKTNICKCFVMETTKTNQTFLALAWQKSDLTVNVHPCVLYTNHNSTCNLFNCVLASNSRWFLGSALGLVISETYNGYRLFFVNHSIYLKAVH